MTRSDGRSVVFPLSSRLTLEVKTPFTAVYSMRGEVLTLRFKEPYPQVRLHVLLTFNRIVAGIDVSATEIVVRIPNFPDQRIPL